MLGGFTTLVAQILTFVLMTQAVLEIANMEEPTLTSYENSLDAASRDEIGAINLKEYGANIAFHVVKFTTYGEPTGP